MSESAQIGGALLNLQPIVEDDATLEALVAELGIVVLMVSIVHLTGSLDLLRSWPRPGRPGFTADAGGGFSPEQERAIRAEALAAIRAWRDAGCPEAYRPNEDELIEMASIMAGSPIGPEYAELVCEDLDASNDPRAFRWSRPVSQSAREAHPVLIIGAGMSGILAGIRLKQAGIPFRIVEKNRGSGGTWHENRYPGCRVDIPSVAYSYSFMQDHDWPSLYSVQEDLEAYFDAVIARYGLGGSIEYDVEAIRADYDEAACEWRVQLRHGDGREETASARSLISAVGFLNRPFIPAIEGAESFKGRAFHTSRWPDDVDLAGKRVGVIGNAATGMQLIPEAARVASHLTIFQRSAQYLSVHPEYHRPVREGERWAFSHLPYYAGWFRVLASNWPNDREPAHMLVDPEWPQDGLTVSAANAFVRQRYLQQIEQSLGDMPELAARVTPNYPVFVKRPCVTSGGFYEALRQDNVTLVTDGIARFVPEGIVDNAGTLHELDVVVYATGFDVQKFVSPITFHGRGGVEIHDQWGNRPGGYLGICVPNFPNFYMLYGPGTNLGYNGNQIFNAECQVRFVMNMIGHAIENDADAVEVRAEVAEDYLARTREKLGKFVWSTNFGTTYFRNSSGEVTTNLPWSLRDIWDSSRQPVADKVISHRAQVTSAGAGA